MLPEPPPGAASGMQARRGLPADTLWLDYGVRFLVIGVADVQEMDALIGSVLEMLRGNDDTVPRQRVDVLALVQSLADDWGEQGQPVSVAPDDETLPAPVLGLAQPRLRAAAARPAPALGSTSHATWRSAVGGQIVLANRPEGRLRAELPMPLA